MSLIKKNRDGSAGIDINALAETFDQKVRDGDGASAYLVEAGQAFTKASGMNGETIELEEGLNRAIAWLGYHDNSAERHSEAGRTAIEEAETQVQAAKPGMGS